MLRSGRRGCAKNNVKRSDATGIMNGSAKKKRDANVTANGDVGRKKTKFEKCVMNCDVNARRLNVTSRS